METIEIKRLLEEMPRKLSLQLSRVIDTNIAYQNAKEDLKLAEAKNYMLIKTKLQADGNKATAKEIEMAMQDCQEIVDAIMEEIKTESEFMQAKMERENLFEENSNIRMLGRLQECEIARGLEDHHFSQPAETEKIKGGY